MATRDVTMFSTYVYNVVWRQYGSRRQHRQVEDCCQTIVSLSKKDYLGSSHAKISLSRIFRSVQSYSQFIYPTCPALSFVVLRHYLCSSLLAFHWPNSGANNTNEDFVINGCWSLLIFVTFFRFLNLFEVFPPVDFIFGWCEVFSFLCRVHQQFLKVSFLKWFCSVVWPDWVLQLQA